LSNFYYFRLSIIVLASLSYTGQSASASGNANCAEVATELHEISKLADGSEEILGRLKAASQKCPQSTDVAYATGVALYRSAKFTEARDLFTKLELSNKESRVASAIARCYFSLNDSAKARLWFNEALARDSKEYSAILGLATLNVRTNNLLEAERLLKKALRLRDDDHMLYYHLGIVFERNSRKDEALAAYQKTLELKSDFWQANVRMADLHIQNGAFSKAKQFAQNVINIAPSNTAGYLAAAKILSKKGSFDSALETLKLAERKCGPDEEVHLAQAIVLIKMGDFKQGDELLQALQVTHPENTSYIAYRAWGLMRAEHYSDAEKLFLDVLKTEPNNLFAMNNLGVLFERTKRLNESRRMFKKCADLYPDIRIPADNLESVRKSISND
jgi:Flp pilus assembly protein TadD